MVGIITEDDRRLLKGEKDDVSERAREQQRVRLRRRIRNGLSDFLILAEELDSSDYEAVFQFRTDDTDADIRTIICALAFLYRGVNDHTTKDFDTLIEMAEEQAAVTEQGITEITGVCSSCGCQNGMRIQSVDVVLLSGEAESICQCGNSVTLTQD